MLKLYRKFKSRKLVFASILLGIALGSFNLPYPLTQTVSANLPGPGGCTDGRECKAVGCTSSNMGFCVYENIYGGATCPTGVRCENIGY